MTQRFLNLFKSRQLSQDFLSVAVDTRDKHDDYTASCKIIHAIKFVNGCAERAVKLATTDFNEVLTKDEKQRQLLHQIIEHHRKLLPSSGTKAQLTKSSN